MNDPNVRLIEVVPGFVLRFEINSNEAVNIWEASRYREWKDSQMALCPDYEDEKEAIDFLFPGGYQEPPKLSDPEPEKIVWSSNATDNSSKLFAFMEKCSEEISESETSPFQRVDEPGN